MTEDKDLKYVWLDLETTGSNEFEDVILEVGVVITDAELNELTALSWVLRDDDEKLVKADSVVQEMHRINGLENDVADAWLSVEDLDLDLMLLLKGYGKKHDFVLAGSGVSHFDRRFLAEYLPTFLKYFRYYSIDVGVLRRTLKLAGRQDLLLPLSQENKTHRALDDARLHLEELRYIKQGLSDA